MTSFFIFVSFLRHFQSPIHSQNKVIWNFHLTYFPPTISSYPVPFCLSPRKCVGFFSLSILSFFFPQARGFFSSFLPHFHFFPGPGDPLYFSHPHFSFFLRPGDFFLPGPGDFFNFSHPHFSFSGKGIFFLFPPTLKFFPPGQGIFFTFPSHTFFFSGQRIFFLVIPTL